MDCLTSCGIHCGELRVSLSLVLWWWGSHLWGCQGCSSLLALGGRLRIWVLSISINSGFCCCICWANCWPLEGHTHEELDYSETSLPGSQVSQCLQKPFRQQDDIKSSWVQYPLESDQGGIYFFIRLYHPDISPGYMVSDGMRVNNTILNNKKNNKSMEVISR